MNHRLTTLLQRPYPQVVWASLAAFLAYSCMYAFRKPFAAASYEGFQLWGMPYKVVLVFAQLAGYMASKFLGIKVVSEMKSGQRIRLLLLLLGMAAFALLLFPLLPLSWRWLALILNGLPLGMIFGIVFSFLEGRRFTEMMSLGLGVSIIFASGLAKSIGKSILDAGWVSQWWMPFVVGLLTLPFLALSVWMLGKIPPPSPMDIAARTARSPMVSAARKALFWKYAPGIILLITGYVLLTSFRDLRDNFAVEIWSALGYSNRPDLLVSAELFISLLVLAAIAGLSFIKKNQAAFFVTQGCIAFGGLVMALSTWLYQTQHIDGILWMTFNGMGLFLAYTVYQGILFERMIATYKETGNVGFLMYLADSMGYLGSAGVLAWREFGDANLSWLRFFIQSAYWISAGVVISTVLALSYFWIKSRKLYPD